jgi:hypothetical protein
MVLSAMILTFLGTRGEIEVRTWRHRMHRSLLVFAASRVGVGDGGRVAVGVTVAAAVAVGCPTIVWRASDR